MFISKELVFIELPKTGTQHIVGLLSKLLDGERVARHQAAKPELFTPGRSFLGSIRDPWEWYVSLWAFGCDRQGAVYTGVTRPRGVLKWTRWRHAPLRSARRVLGDISRNPHEWRRCYSDVHDAGRFRAWLHMMHDERCWNDIPGKYGESSVSKLGGFLTYTYVTLFCKNIDSTAFESTTSLDALREFERRNCYMDRLIRNERLEEDLIAALELSGRKLSEAERSAIRSSGRTNRSSRREGAAYYYDQETVDLVHERDRLIVEKFGYAPPRI